MVVMGLMGLKVQEAPMKKASMECVMIHFWVVLMVSMGSPEGLVELMQWVVVELVPPVKVVQGLELELELMKLTVDLSFVGALVYFESHPRKTFHHHYFHLKAVQPSAH